MTAQLSPVPVFKAFSNDGFPLAFGQLTTYQAGTTTKIATYVDSTQTTQNTNPIRLNARGECALWLDPNQSYKFLLQDFFGNTIPGYPVDNIPGSGATQGFFYGAESGIVNSYVVTTSFGGIFALVVGYLVRFNTVNTNTGASTINVNNTGAISVIGETGLALTGGEILSTGPTWVQYTGSAWQIVGTGALPDRVRTATEISQSVTPSNYTYVFGDPRRYGAAWDGTTNDSAAFSKCVSVGLALLPVGTGMGTFSIRRNNFSIIGPGSAVCTIKNPPGTLSPGGVVEVGDTASGNSATPYTWFTAKGFTIDGNRANATAPLDDLHGHGICLTKISNYTIQDIFIENAWNAGCGIFLNSNFGIIQGQASNCGNATFTPPGFDINASKHITVDWISSGCNVGCRVLQNCNNINGRLDAYNSGAQGIIVQSIAPNLGSCSQLNIDGTVDTTVSQGVLIQESIRDSNFRFTIINAGTIGCQIPAGSSSAADCIDNNIDIITENSQQQGMLDFSRLSRIKHTSRLDGVSGAPGTYYALDVNGNNNVYESIVDGNAQVRSVAVRAGATGNVFLAWLQTNSLSGFNDAGTNTSRVPLTYETTITGTFNLTSGAAPTIVTAAITGVAFGDVIAIAWPSDLQGVIAWAYVQSAGHVSVAAYNITGGALNFGSITVTIRITKQ